MAENVIVFHPGRQHSVKTAEAYFKAGMLAAFCTSLLFRGEEAYAPRWLALLGPKLGQRVAAYVARYRIVELPSHKVLRYGLWEYVERIARTLRLPRLADKIDAHGNVRFGRASSRVIDRLLPAAVVGFNGATKEIFEHAKTKNMICVLEQTIGHPAEYNAIFAEHALRYARYFAATTPPVPAAQIARQDIELELADLVVVGGAYAKQSLERHGVKPGKVRVIEYGHGFVRKNIETHRVRGERGRVEFVFVGAVDVRKGCHLLIEAMRRLRDHPVHLTMVGPVNLPIKRIRDLLPANVSFAGKLMHEEVESLMANADCFVFPSLFEGSAIALREAQFARLPIIQTERAGAGCVPGVSGLYVEPDADDLAEKLALFARDGPLRSRLMANARKAVPRSWADYQAELAAAVRLAIKKPSL